MESYHPEETCRTCLQKSDELTSLLSKDDDTGLTLLEKLCFCASMQVVMSEHTPSNACSQCVRRIAEYYDFKQRCALSEKTLEELYNKPSAYTATKFEAEEYVISSAVVKTESEDFNLSCHEPSAYTENEIEIDYGEEEDADSAESDILDLFCDDDSKLTPCIDGEEEVNAKKLSPSHVDERKKGPKHACDMCSGSFMTAERLRRHKQVRHSAIKQYHCNQCDVHFRSVFYLRVHMEIKHKGHACETCGKSYRLHSSLLAHIRENHADKPKVYECNVCGKTYNFRQSLFAHKLTHKPYDPRCVCDQCGRSFRNSYRLKQHIRLTHKKSHACDVCDKRFGCNTDLLSHKAHHLNEMAKPYGCDLCEKRFWAKAAVTFHVSTLHKGNEHQKCDVCGEIFHSQSGYVAHYSGHTGVKPYHCDGCKKGFNYKTTLMRHKKKCASLLALTQQ